MSQFRAQPLARLFSLFLLSPLALFAGWSRRFSAAAVPGGRRHEVARRGRGVGASALLMALLAGCASQAPVPVVDSQSSKAAETAKSGAGVTPPAAMPAPTSPARMYTVRKGDTLIGIAREQGVSVRDIAAWNNLEAPHRLSIGQQLQLSAPAAAPVATNAAGGTEVRAIAAGGGVTSRPLESAPLTPAPEAVAPAPSFSAQANTESLKRGPKGGKLPYSEDNLARLKGQMGQAGQSSPAAVPAVSPASAATSPSSASSAAVTSAPGAVPSAAAPYTPLATPPATAVPPPAPAPSAPAAAPSKPATAETGGIEWSWPASGKLLAGFTDGGAGQEMSKGLDIGGKIGDPVLAAAPGKVIFVGVFPKHGNLVVVLHAGGYSSVYAHNSRILVKEGQLVTRGQKLAELGNSDADQPKLHFEVRQQGKPLDPMKVLPTR